MHFLCFLAVFELIWFFFALIPMKISQNLYGRMDGSKFWCFPWFPENSLLCVILRYTVYKVLQTEILSFLLFSFILPSSQKFSQQMHAKRVRKFFRSCNVWLLVFYSKAGRKSSGSDKFLYTIALYSICTCKIIDRIVFDMMIF